MTRNRLTLFSLLLLTMAAGLATRSERAAFLPEFVRAYGGDTLWAAALYVLLALLRPSAPTGELLLVTVLMSFAVEFSQLYQADWIDRLRHTFPLGYLLGYGFKWSDLLCYTAGSLLAGGVDRLHSGRRRF